MTLEQSLEQCLEKRMDGSCRSHPPVEDQLLLWTGKTYEEVEITKLTDKDKYQEKITPKSVKEV